MNTLYFIRKDTSHSKGVGCPSVTSLLVANYQAWLRFTGGRLLQRFVGKKKRVVANNELEKERCH